MAESNNQSNQRVTNAVLRKDIKHVKEAVERIEALLHEMNGKVDKNTENLAVLKDWREQHEKHHGTLNKIIASLAGGNVIATAIGSFFGIKNG